MYICDVDLRYLLEDLYRIPLSAMDGNIVVLPCRVEDNTDFIVSNGVVGSGGYGVIKYVRDARPGINMTYACKHIDKKPPDDRRDTCLSASKTADSDLYALKCVKGGPFLAQLYFYYDCSDYLQLLCADYAHRGDLFEFLQVKNVLSNEEVAFVASELVVALNFLHDKQVVYRDLKTENVLILSDGHIQLTDFGFAVQLSDENPKTNEFCGTLDYMAPEMVKKLPYAYEVDWWALGVLMYELLAGLPPFHDEDKHVILENILSLEAEIPLHVHVAAANIIVRLTDKSQEGRLGANGSKEVMTHWFFKGVNWDDLPTKSLKSPLLPVPREPRNLSYEYQRSSAPCW